jgi:hypothetical protein
MPAQPKEERPRVVVRRPPPRPAPEPVPAPPPVRTVVADPPKSDSVVVRVYRGDKLSQQKFAKKDTSGTP